VSRVRGVATGYEASMTLGKQTAAAPLAFAALALALLAAGCGGSPAGEAAPGGADASAAPSGAALCAPPDTTDKRLPEPARKAIARFVAALDAGDLGAARAEISPATADDVLRDLAAVRRLELLALEDRY